MMLNNMQSLRVLFLRLAGVLVLCTALLAFMQPSSAEEITIDHQGTPLLGSLELAEGKSLKDGVVLLVHGTFAHKDMEIISQMSAGLVERGYNALSITLSLSLPRREGMLDCAIEHRHKHTDAVDEIDAWVNYIETQGASSLAVFGHSRGGNQVAWWAAERGQAKPGDFLKAIALAAPSTWVEEKARASYRNRYEKKLNDVLMMAEEQVAAGNGDDLLPTPVGFVYCPNAKVSAQAFLNYYKPDQRFDTLHLLPNITTPTLVVAAGADTVVADLPDREGEIAEAGVPFTVIDGADHMFLDFFAYDLVDAVAGFLEENNV